jgi:hypothetical protein
VFLGAQVYVHALQAFGRRPSENGQECPGGKLDQLGNGASFFEGFDVDDGHMPVDQ